MKIIYPATIPFFAFNNKLSAYTILFYKFYLKYVDFYAGDYKRVKGKGYTFVIPKEWVGDTFVELAKAQRAVQPLDYKMKQGGRGATLPDAGK